jgi:light-regulated signal transduction histidine kinase (bacteriophytochrome)
MRWIRPSCFLLKQRRRSQYNAIIVAATIRAESQQWMNKKRRRTRAHRSCSCFWRPPSHDMKNSISVLSGTLENLLAAHPSNSAPEYGQMAHMLYQTKRLNDNLIQLLALYKDVGKPGYPFEPARAACANW